MFQCFPTLSPPNPHLISIYHFHDVEVACRVLSFGCFTITDVDNIGDRNRCPEGSEAQLLPQAHSSFVDGEAGGTF